MNRTQQIESVIQRANLKEIEEGRTWYHSAHEFCKELSEEFGIELPKVVGVLSALSVQKRWDLNKKITREFLQGKRNVHFRSQVMKAVRILEGYDIELCLGGLKTVNFFRNILNPAETEWITIDRWMLRMFNEPPKITPKQYNGLKNTFIDYSKGKDLVGCQYQAICWLNMINSSKHGKDS